jgi:hypothetical protein
MVVVLMVFCLRLPETNARRPGRLARGRRTWVSVSSMRSSTPAGGGVGDHICQGVHPHAGCIGDGEATPGQQRSDLVDCAGDGGAVHPVQHCQGLVGQLGPQDYQGDQHPVTEHQPLAGSGAGGALA